jgi:hypothetical protein
MLSEINQAQKDKHCIYRLYVKSKTISTKSKVEWWLQEPGQGMGTGERRDNNKRLPISS